MEEEEEEAEEAVVTFGELDLSDYDSDLDADYSPEEEDTEDELEYCSEVTSPSPLSFQMIL